MKLVCCVGGHFYDAEAHGDCPYCHEKGLRAGRTISPRLERVAADGLELIGHGATSDVYRAGERFVLKAVDSERMPELFESVRHEIDIMWRLAGISGVVWLLDHEIVGSASGVDYAWLLMPYYTPFPEYLSKREMPELERLKCVAELCRALARCRDAGVVHLDVQPKNIYVDNRGDVLLGDFGVSLFIEELTANREKRGTLAYMAPEVYRDGLCGERSDIYSLGLVLYGLFNGRVLPFMDECDRDEAIRRRLRGEAFPDVRCGSESLTRHVMRIVRRACDPDAGARFPRFEAMEDALRRAMEPPAPAPKSMAAPRRSLLGRIAGRLFDKRDDKEIGAQATVRAVEWPTAPLSDGNFAATTGSHESASAPGGRAGAVPPPTFDADPVATTMVPLNRAEGQLPASGNASPGLPRFSDAEDRGDAAVAPSLSDAAMPAYFDADPVATSMARPVAGSGPSGPVSAKCALDEGDMSFFDDDLNATTLGITDKAPVSGAALKTDRVEFTAVAPKSFARGEYTMIDIVMYEAAFRSVVDELMRQSDEPLREKRGGVAEVTRRDRVRIVLSAPDVQIEEDEQTMPWQGGYLDFSFAVLLPEDFSRQQLVFTARVYINDVPRVRLMFTAKVDSPREQRLEVFRKQVMSAFVSYASQDRKRVASMIQGMQKICPELDVFFDINSLHSGEYWEQTLRREIDRRDVLFLCWSRNASKSEWVEREWRYALEQKGLEGIEPLPIEPADVCPPPPELESKHFNDMMLYIIGPDAWDGTDHGKQTRV